VCPAQGNYIAERFCKRRHITRDFRPANFATSLPALNNERGVDPEKTTAAHDEIKLEEQYHLKDTIAPSICKRFVKTRTYCALRREGMRQLTLRLLLFWRFFS
jgi:hypothetical protein